MMCKNFLVFVILLFPFAALSDDYELTLTGELESDSTTKQEEILLKFEQEDEEKKYSQDIKLNIDNGFTKTNGEFVKSKELFDYEHELKYFHESDFFYTGYFRRNRDSFATSTSSNYTLITVGAGLKKEHEDEEILVQLSAGQRRNSFDDVFILMPKVSYENKYKEFSYKLSSSLVKESDIEIFSNELEVSYPLSETLSLKYISEYESSEDESGKDFNRLNKIALSIKW